MTGTLVRREERREELIGGKRVAMSPASAGHAYVSDNILRIFKNYLKGKTCGGGPFPQHGEKRPDLQKRSV